MWCICICMYRNIAYELTYIHALGTGGQDSSTFLSLLHCSRFWRRLLNTPRPQHTAQFISSDTLDRYTCEHSRKKTRGCWAQKGLTPQKHLLQNTSSYSNVRIAEHIPDLDLLNPGALSFKTWCSQISAIYGEVHGATALQEVVQSLLPKPTDGARLQSQGFFMLFRSCRLFMAASLNWGPFLWWPYHESTTMWGLYNGP